MVIRSAKFITSSPTYDKCPQTNLPEFAFIGRSNVGKSSLINMLTGIGSLAKVSQTPGKTQIINHFLINERWYLVDLPGYGYAKVSKTSRKLFSEMIASYIQNRDNLFCLFVLIDSRLEPQKIDISFMNWLGQNEVPFSLIFTKTDKINAPTLQNNIEVYKKEMLNHWDELPPIFTSSAVTRIGREAIIEYVENIVKNAKNILQKN